jgi:class 3 adenylate cyclase
MGVLRPAMQCPTCQHENTRAARFCESCGAQLARRCPGCNEELGPQARFCPGCGTPIADSQQSLDTRPEKPVLNAVEGTGATRDDRSGSIAVLREHESPFDKLRAGSARITTEDGERKTVTALFADIKGSMELIEDLDPEDARAIVDPALTLMIESARRFDGYIVQSTGDGIFALFGAPVAHEDHPQRALYAALRMQEELKRYSDRIRADGGVPMQVRVGVNTGEVVVRSIRTGETDTEYTPIGHSTSLAARMQALAPIGSIATTDAVRRLCEGYFVFKDLGPTRVKGVSEPIHVHEVTGLGLLRTRL